MAGHMALMKAFPEYHPTFLAFGVISPAVIIVIALEYLFPYRKTWNKIDQDFWMDLFLTNMLFPLLVEGISLGLKWTFGDGYGTFWPRSAPMLAQLALALLMGEFFFYWIHRLGHETSLFWKFHEFHHTPRRVYWMNAARFHPIDLIANFTFYFLPMAILGAPTEVFALVFCMNAATGLLEHANIDFDAGWLNRIFNTAQLHRWHHSVDVRISQTNYGKVLSVWDQVFGTYHLPEVGQVGEVGVHERPIEG